MLSVGHSANPHYLFLTLNRVILVTGGHGDNFEGQCVLQMQDLVGSYSVSGSPNHSKALRRHSSSAGK